MESNDFEVFNKILVPDVDAVLSTVVINELIESLTKCTYIVVFYRL